MKVTVEIIAKSTDIDPLLVPWVIQRLNKKYKEKGYNPFIIPSMHHLLSGLDNRIDSH